MRLQVQFSPTMYFMSQYRDITKTRRLNGKKEDIKGEFTNEEMLEYVQSL